MQVSATWQGLSDVLICIGCSREHRLLKDTASKTASERFVLYIHSVQPIGPLSPRASMPRRSNERALPLYRCAFSI